MTSALGQLKALVDQLRTECPWDREQTMETLKTYLLEESYEVLEAVDQNDAAALAGELGDLLIQIFFIVRLAEERSWFDLETVARGIIEKMVARHPHVFGSTRVRDADEVKANWERRKSREPERQEDPLSGVPPSLPALLAAYRMSCRAADLGFDWERDADILRKVEEEIREVREAAQEGGRKRTAEEIGDLLFTIVNLARRASIDPEDALRRANARFRRRFARVAEQARLAGRELAQMTLAEMDELWEKAKAEEERRNED